MLQNCKNGLIKKTLINQSNVTQSKERVKKGKVILL